MITSPSLPLGREVIRLAVLGCTSGNGHPYSWSAIFNGYDRELMTAECPFPTNPHTTGSPPGWGCGEAPRRPQDARRRPTREPRRLSRRLSSKRGRSFAGRMARAQRTKPARHRCSHSSVPQSALCALTVFRRQQHNDLPAESPFGENGGTNFWGAPCIRRAGILRPSPSANLVGVTKKRTCARGVAIGHGCLPWLSFSGAPRIRARYLIRRLRAGG